jgi:hypothetical protein
MSDDRATRAAREKAMARPELRGTEFYFDFPAAIPPEGEKLFTVVVTDGPGPQYKLPFNVIYRDGRWFNPRYGDKQLTVRVIRWRFA